MLMAESGYNYFIVDGSGSMHGVGLLEAKNAMQKIGKYLFSNGEKVALVVGVDQCIGGTRIATKFYTTLEELNVAMEDIDPTSGHNITLGFEYAQEKMENEGKVGHIYMFGDCDGLNHCRSIESIADKYKKKSALTPFTYIQVAGCTQTEKQSWKITLSKIGGSTHTAETFDYASIVNTRKMAINKKYFLKPKYINENSTENEGKNYRTKPWKCIESDGLMWLVITKEEQILDFYINLKNKNKNSISVREFIDTLDGNDACGKSDWRLPDDFELSRLTQLGPNIRAKMFPYIKIWPHISSTGGEHHGFRKGIDLANGKIYDYREDRPYAAIFVSGDIDKTLFVPPEELLNRYKVRKGIHAPAPNPTKSSPQPDPIIRCTLSMVNKEECTDKQMNRWYKYLDEKEH
jgi:hypothetical protein